MYKFLCHGLRHDLILALFTELFYLELLNGISLGCHAVCLDLRKIKEVVNPVLAGAQIDTYS